MKSLYILILITFLSILEACGYRCEEVPPEPMSFQIQIVNKDLKPIIGYGNEFNFHPDSIKIYFNARGDLKYGIGNYNEKGVYFGFEYTSGGHPESFDTTFYIHYPDGDIDTIREFTIRHSKTELSPCKYYEFGVQHEDTIFSSLLENEAIYKIIKH